MENSLITLKVNRGEKLTSYRKTIKESNIGLGQKFCVYPFVLSPGYMTKIVYMNKHESNLII